MTTFAAGLAYMPYVEKTKQQENDGKAHKAGSRARVNEDWLVRRHHTVFDFQNAHLGYLEYYELL